MSNRKRRRIPGVTVYMRGKLYWYVVELEPDPLSGKRRRQYRGGFQTEEEAWSAAIETKAAVDQSRHIKPSRRTVAEFFGEWLDATKHALKPSTYANYRDYLSAYVLPTIGTRRLQDVDVPMLNTFYRHLLERGRRKPDNNTVMYEYWRSHRTAEHEPRPKEIACACGTTIYAARAAVTRYRSGRVPAPKSAGLAPKTVKNIHRMLHRALKDAVAWRYLTYNPAEHASLPRTPRTARAGAGARHAVWTVEQLADWLNIALNDRFAGLWMLAATTGMRRSELAGLRRGSLNLSSGQVIMGDDTRVVVQGRAQNSDGKTEASSRILSLDELTIEWLRRYVDMVEAERAELGASFTEDDHLLCYPDGRAPHPQTITRMFNRLADRAGAPRIRLHDVRHTYATLALDAGIDLKIVSDRLGHANVYVTAQIYGHRSTGRDRDAAERVARLVELARAQHERGSS